jgi:hypothetical protein
MPSKSKVCNIHGRLDCPSFLCKFEERDRREDHLPLHRRG